MKDRKQALRPIDKPFYRYWQAFYLSFFSRRLYVDVGKRWRGFGVLYFLLLVFVMTIPFTLRLISNFNQGIEEQMIKPIQQLPKIIIQNGRISLNKPMPYLIKNEKGQVVAAVDTSGTIKKMNASFPALTILITKDKFIYRLPPWNFYFSKAGESKSIGFEQPISKQLNEVFEGKDWIKNSHITILKYFSEFIIYPTIALFFFVTYLVLFLVLALMGQFTSKLFYSFSITYKQSCRLLMVSATPSLALLLLALAFNWLFSGINIVVLILLLVYFNFAVISFMRESKKLVVS